MPEFTVSEVIDGDTFKVKNGWKWDNKTGDTVRPCLRVIRTGRQLGITLLKKMVQFFLDIYRVKEQREDYQN